jgi:hypothetical protein
VEFFGKLGFRRKEWEILAAAFRVLAQTTEVTSHAESPHGSTHIIVGQIESPVGKPVAVKTIWIVDKGLDVARCRTRATLEERKNPDA